MRTTRCIDLGGVSIGGGSPVSIQSMTNLPWHDVDGTLAQIDRLAALGCQIIRVAVPSHDSLSSLASICSASKLPVVADIHFDHRLAIGAMESGAAGIRVNPGNMRNVDSMRQVARIAANRGCVVRIGVNCGSLDPEIEASLGRGAEGMVRSAMKYVSLFEAEGCMFLKVSLKSSDVRSTVEACRMFAARSDIPLHLGVTEAGPPSRGVVKSAIGIGSLLLDGIGETIRVSLTCEPEEEIRTARRILSACGMLDDGPEVVSCPTCGRTRVDLVSLATAVEQEIERLLSLGKRIDLRKVAVMGCEVNGPGEARDADVGIAGGKGTGVLFRKGEKVCTLEEGKLLEALLEEIRRAAH